MSHSERDSAAPASWRERWRAALAALPAWPFFLGLALGFGACCGAGRVVSGRPMLENFVRFFGPIQPQRQFYPTPSLLAAHIRHTVPREKTLVLVGGASYFRGTGQNPGELWSLELQRQLGPRFAVVNFAIDRAEITSFAAVVFQILARDYPSMIYVANGSAHSTPPADGGEDYRYFFWDAHYKGLLPAAADSPEIQRLRRHQLRDDAGRELHLGKWLDRFAYACDLWTYVGYRHFFTVWTEAHRDAPFAPRRLAREGDDPNLGLHQANARKDAAYAKHNEDFARAASRERFMRTPAGDWAPDAAAWARLRQEFDLLFPAELRARVFVVLLRGNPHFMQSLTAEERRRTDQIYRLGQQAYEEEGYRVVPLRAEDLEADDFLDSGHLMASGGHKVARAVAARIKAVEQTAATPAVPLGPVELRLTLPADGAPRKEPVLTIPHARGAEQLAIEYLDGGKIRFGYTPADGVAEVFSPAIEAAPGSTPTLTASLATLYPHEVAAAGGLLSSAELRALRSWFLLRRDGQPFWEIPLLSPPDSPGELQIGRGFSGRIESSPRQPAPPTRLARHLVGGARLRLTVDDAMKGRAFPLLTTGRTGTGDVLFLRVTADGHVVLGHDHWGALPQLSPPIAWSVGRTCTLELRLPTAAQPDLAVLIDGEIAWRKNVERFPFTSAQVFFGHNPIGSTLAEPALVNAVFEGVLAPAWRD